MGSGYAFTGRLKEAFIHIASWAKHVNLGFTYGATLADPHCLLMGSGKRVRHIKILGVQDLEKPYLKESIRAAIAPAARVQKAAADVPLAPVRENYPVKRRPAKKA